MKKIEMVNKKNNKKHINSLNCSALWCRVSETSPLSSGSSGKKGKAFWHISHILTRDEYLFYYVNTDVFGAITQTGDLVVSRLFSIKQIGWQTGGKIAVNVTQQLSTQI